MEGHFNRGEGFRVAVAVTHDDDSNFFVNLNSCFGYTG